MRPRIGIWCVWLVVGTGLLVAAVSGLFELVPEVQALCLGVSGECRETAQYTLFGIPVWAWGAGFYLALAAVLALARQWLPLLVAAGLGVELHLAWVMLSQRLFCTICLANLAVVLLLAAITLTRERPWRLTAFCLLGLLAAQAVMARGGAPAASLPAGEAEVALVAGEAITEAQLESALSAQLIDLREKIYTLKQERLEAMVRDRVLKLEAAAQGLGVAELLEKEAHPKAEPVTEDEVESVAKRSRPDLVRFNWSEEELRRRVREFLARNKREAAEKAYVASLYPKYGVRIMLVPPRSQLLVVDPGNSPSQGPADAAVTVVEFSDYQCPACRRSHPTVVALREKYRDRVRWVFKDYPLNIHKDARLAAEASHCAGEQGQYWEYQDLLYAADDLTRPGLEKLAQDLGLERERFVQCLDQGRSAAIVDRDMADAARLGLGGTPTYLVNGRLVNGTPAMEKFTAIIDTALAAAPKPKP